MIAVRGKAEIKLFTKIRTFSGLVPVVSTRRKSNLVSGYVMKLRTEKNL